MSVSEPNTPSSAGIGSIPEPNFTKGMRGYNPDQVTAYLKGMATRLRSAEERAAELESELEQSRRARGTDPSARSSDPYDTFSRHVADVVRAFDQDVERARREAEAEAQRIVTDAATKAQGIMEQRSAAHAEAEQMRDDARAVVERMLENARAEGDAVRLDAQAKGEEIIAEAERGRDVARDEVAAAVSELESQRATLLTELRTLHSRMLETAGDLERMLEGNETADDVVVVDEGRAPWDRASAPGPEVFSPEQ